MRLHIRSVALAISIMVGLTASAAAAGKNCKVSDPVDSSLNVRETPNGTVINRLKNGRIVQVLDTSTDDQGRPWAYVGGRYGGTYRQWGWVFREYIVCFD